MTPDVIHAVVFSLAAAAIATVLILPPALGIAWLLARRTWRGKAFVETLVVLPLVMPPVATGLILLQLLGRRGPIGGFLHETAGIDVAFTRGAVVIAMAVMSFPLLARSARAAFETVDPRLEGVARTLGAGEWRVFSSVTLPLAARGVLAGVLLGFARAVGEFGATVMVAGNIPGKTATLAASIYQSVQLGDDSVAGQLLLVSLAIAFSAAALGEWLVRRKR